MKKFFWTFYGTHFAQGFKIYKFRFWPTFLLDKWKSRSILTTLYVLRHFDILEHFWKKLKRLKTGPEIFKILFVH